MRLWLELPDRRTAIDPTRPIRLAYPIRNAAPAPRAFGLPPARIAPVRSDGFIGCVAEGGPCNCDRIELIAHAHCTHTECLGHLTSEPIRIADCLTRSLFRAYLVSIEPLRLRNGDAVITAEQLQQRLPQPVPEALILRALRGDMPRDFSGTNPPYLTPGAAELLAHLGVQHLLTDLPSVDREQDGGRLLAHRAFWNYPAQPRLEATISELLRIPPTLPDGEYLLELQVLDLDSDASPSIPTLYALLEP
jgi:kynurenine formamidase